MSKKYIVGELKEFIVAQYAAFEMPKKIQALVLERFKITVPIDSIRKVKSRDAGLIDEARERLKKQLDAIPLANVFWRIKQRQDLIDDIKNKNDGTGLWWKDKDGIEKGNHLVINKLLDSAAEEFKQVFSISIDTDAVNVLNMNIADFEKFLDKEKESELVGVKTSPLVPLQEG